MPHNLITGEGEIVEEEKPERLVSEMFNYLDGPGKDAIKSFCDVYQIDGIKTLDKNLRSLVERKPMETSTFDMFTHRGIKTKIRLVDVTGSEFNVVVYNDQMIAAFQFLHRADPKKPPSYMNLQTKF